MENIAKVLFFATAVLGLLCRCQSVAAELKAELAEEDLANGYFRIKSAQNERLFITVNENGAPQQYVSNITSELEAETDLTSRQKWYVQKVVYYPVDDIQLRIIHTQSSFGYNNADVELPQGSYYFYTTHWRMIPTKGGRFALEFYSQRAFGRGSGLCLQNSGRGRAISFSPCRLNKKAQQWSFEQA